MVRRELDILRVVEQENYPADSYMMQSIVVRGESQIMQKNIERFLGELDLKNPRECVSLKDL